MFLPSEDCHNNLKESKDTKFTVVVPDRHMLFQNQTPIQWYRTVHSQLYLISQICQNHSFFVSIFSQRFSREKCPILTVASFFSSDYNLTLIGPLFLQSKLLKLIPQGQVPSAEISAKGFPLFIFYYCNLTYKPRTRLKAPLSIFFGIVRLFFENF